MKIQNLLDIKEISKVDTLPYEINFRNVLDGIFQANFYLSSKDFNSHLPHIFCLGQNVEGLHFISKNKVNAYDYKKEFDTKTIMAMAVVYLSNNNPDIHFLEHYSFMQHIEVQSLKENYPMSKLDFSYFCFRTAKIEQFKKCDS